MKFVLSLFRPNREEKITLAQKDKAQDFLVKLGEEQFKKLISKGLTVPIALL